MKVNFKKIFVASVVLAFAACTKTPVENTTPQEIVVVASSPQTKAMFTETTWKKAGNRLVIYDFNPSTDEPYFKDYVGPDVIGNTYGNTNVWPFENAPHSWTADEHKFFGWLAKDANMPENIDTPEEFFDGGFSFDNATKVLTIGPKAMTASTPQFDFLYSNIVPRFMATNPDYSPVRLNFSHLFTAVSFGADNSTNSDIQIHEFRIENILNKRTAEISFNGAEPVISYINATSDQFLNRTSGEFSLPSGTHFNDIFTQSEAQSFMMLWPLAADQLYSTGVVDDKNSDGDITYEDYPTDYKMFIHYTVDGGEYKKRMNFPNAPWEAGKRYHYDILFADKAIELKVKVKPWEYEHQDVDYTDAALTVPGKLTWDLTASAVDEDAKTVTIVNAQPAKASFTISTPLGGSWMVSLSGDVNAFEVTPDNGEIDANTAHITIKPLIKDPKRDYKVRLKFAVRRADGRVITADEVQSEIYTVVLPQNN